MAKRTHYLFFNTIVNTYSRRFFSFGADIDQQRKCFDDIFNVLNLKTWEDWYKVKHFDVILQGGYKILHNYNYDWTNAVVSLYPEHNWKISKFNRRVNEYWKTRANQQIFLKRFCSEYKIQSLEDFYKVKQKEIVDYGGKVLLNYFGNSHIALFLFNYPELPWHIWRFNTLPPNFWRSIIQQRNFFLELGNSMQYKNVLDFYNIKYKDIVEYGGSGLLALYGNSHINAIKRYWESQENVKKCMDWLAKEFFINEPYQWTRISTHHLKEKGLHSLVTKFGNIQNILEFCFPDYDWNQHHSDFWQIANTAKIQKQLFEYVREAIPNK